MAGLEEPRAEPHYHGHRDRLRERLLSQGANTLADYELLEFALFAAVPRRDTKPLAKALLARFGSLAEIVAAPPQRLAEVEGVGERVIAELKLLKAFAERLARESVRQRPLLASWGALLDYCRTAMAYEDREQFRILFLQEECADSR